MFRASRPLAACVALLCTTAASAAFAATLTTNASNATPIAITDFSAAAPYGSGIVVSGLHGDITSVTVTLNGLSHTYPDDVEVLLVAPGGQQVKLMSDTGGSVDLSNINLTFSTASAARLPDSAGIASGTYLPTDIAPVGDLLPAPAPTGPYSADLATLQGPAAAQNGTWRLYVSDDARLDAGRIAGGWTLSVTAEGFESCAAEGYAGSQLALCRQICEVDHPPQRLNGLLRAWMVQFKSEPPCAD